MPVFKPVSGKAPIWCQLESFDIVRLKPGEEHSFNRQGKKEKLIICKGACSVIIKERTIESKERTNLDLSEEGDSFSIRHVVEPVVAVRMCGRWGDEIGGSGLFPVKANTDAPDNDTPYNYKKTTSFDNHYHDCDEYWVIYQGRGIVYSENRRYEVGPGDCVATGMGFHHDFPEVVEGPVKAVYFETTMEGKKRPGHLHEPQDGKAVPRKERV